MRRSIASNIMAFVGKQQYEKSASIDVMLAALNRVVLKSERLTVLVFCDGETAIGGTPFDSGINQIFHQRESAQKKAKQPFIIVFRAQLGEYVGCTVNFPPLPVNFPYFPPLPPPAPNTASNPPPVIDLPPPAVTLPPLIIVGTNVGTNFPPPEPNPEPTNPAPPVQTNMISAIPTNPVVPPPENSELSSDGSLAIGAAFLAAAGGLTLFMLRRSRKTNSSSLITQTMKKD